MILIKYVTTKSILTYQMRSNLNVVTAKNTDKIFRVFLYISKLTASDIPRANLKIVCRHFCRYCAICGFWLSLYVGFDVWPVTLYMSYTPVLSYTVFCTLLRPPRRLCSSAYGAMYYDYQLQSPLPRYMTKFPLYKLILHGYTWLTIDMFDTGPKRPKRKERN